ncbi:hypothetical protein FRC17_005552 [Serendipita sp. 399]|nr:hypothetical protein FRC17_005552 [Serendipita sp. 399]
MEREETLSNVILASPPPAVVLPSTSPPPSSSLGGEAEDGRLKSPGDAVGDTTGLRKTGWITSRGAVCFATFVILLIGLTGAVLWSLYIGNHRAIYLLHFYRRDLLLQASRAEAAAAAAAAAERAQKNPLILRWLRRTSSSSFSSLFEKGSRWLSGFEIPTIKIDLASDDSSASAYSTDDSAGYRSQQFGLPPLGAGADGGAGAVSQQHQQQSASAVVPPASLPQAHLHTHGLVLPVLEYRRG